MPENPENNFTISFNDGGAAGVGSSDIAALRNAVIRSVEIEPRAYSSIFAQNEKKEEKKEKQKPYEERLKEAVLKGWRLIRAGETLVYPCMVLKDTYRPESGWNKINVLGVDKLNKPFRSMWGYYIVPIKSRKKG